MDHGLTYYASPTTLAPGGQRIMIDWMDNWETCKEAPHHHPWYAQMCMSREVFIKNGRLYQSPVWKIERVWQDIVAHEQVTVCEETSLPACREGYWT